MHGEVFFVTKGQGQEEDPATPLAFARLICQLLEWKLILLPNSLTRAGMLIAKVVYTVRVCTMRLFGVSASSTLPGVPFHLFAEMALYEQTFDNSKARRILGFEPQITCQAFIEQAVEKWRAEHGKSGAGHKGGLRVVVV